MKITVGSRRVDGELVEIDLGALMLTHTRVQGSTGAGKSRLLVLLAREIIKAGYSLQVIDGKGDLVDALELDFAWQMFGPDRVFIIDPAETAEFAPGFNPIALHGREPYTKAKGVLEAFKRLHGEEEFKPWLEMVMLNALVPLSHAGLGLLELEEFLQDDHLRETLVQAAPDRRLHRFWEHLESKRPQDKDAILSAATTRASLLWSGGEGIRRILGQVRDTLDWEKVLSPGSILLVDANTSSGVDPSAARFLGTLCLQKIIEAASVRSRDKRTPTFLIVDELHSFASSDVVEALEKLRGFGVHLILAHHFLEQLEEVPGLLGAVDSCAQNRFIFSASAPDAARLQDELFAGHRPDRAIIQELHAPVFAPEQRWVDVESVAHHEELTTENSGSETTRYHPETTSVSHEPDGIIFSGDEVGHTTSEGYWETSETEPSYNTTPEHEVVTRSKQFITEYEERDQVTSRQLENLEELKEHGRVALMRQPRQTCVFQLQHTAPIALRIADVRHAETSDELLRRWKRLINRTYRRADVLDQELENRAQDFLETKTKLDAEEFQTIETTPLSVPKKKKR